MAMGALVLRMTAKGLARQEQALQRRIDEVEDAFAKDPSLSRATIMNNFQVRYETRLEIERLMAGDH